MWILKKFIPGLALAIVVSLFLGSEGLGAYPRPVRLHEEMPETPAGPFMDILKNAGKALTIDDILAKKGDSGFESQKSQFPVLGNKSSVCWVRFRVENPDTKKIKWALEVTYPLIDSVRLYAVSPEGVITDTREAGDRMPFSKREMDYRNFVFFLEELPGSSRTFYVRFETIGPMNPHLVIWPMKSFIMNVSTSQIVFGLYYGAMLVMLAYNLFVFFSVRDRSYLYYVLYYLFFVVFQLSMNGLAYQYLWPDSVWWHNDSMPLLINLCIIFAIQFSRHFLHIKNHLPRVDRLMRYAVYAFSVTLPLSMLFDYSVMLQVSVVSAIMLAVVLTAASLRILFKGYRPARYYVTAWTLFWIGTVVYGLKILGFIEDNLMTRWVLHATSLMEVTLLSLGLADRINQMKMDLQYLNVNLERLVEDRTRKLNETMAEMAKNEREIEMEFELAGNIQQGILPRTPFYYEGIKISAFYRAMGQVGGDFYDIFHMKGGYLGVLIADASGHGMPAAFITALAKISFNEAIQRHLFPSDIFRQVNIELIEAIKTDDFATAFFLVIGPTFDVMYGNASHQKALVIRSADGRMQEWDTNGLFVGSLPAANSMYEDKQDMLDYGDRVLLYTDGLVEIRNEQGETFGDIRLKNLAVETMSLPLEEAKDRIISRWSEFAGKSPQADDVTLVIVEIDPAYRDLTEYREKGFSLLSSKRYHEAVLELLRANAINPRDEKTHLYLGECYLKTSEYSNAVNHLLQFLRNNEIDANVWFHLSQAYFHLDEFEMAYKTSQKAAQLRINFLDAMILCAYSLRHLGRNAEAIKTLERVIAIDPGHELAVKELQDITEHGS